MSQLTLDMHVHNTWQVGNNRKGRKHFLISDITFLLKTRTQLASNR